MQLHRLHSRLRKRECMVATEYLGSFTGEGRVFATGSAWIAPFRVESVVQLPTSASVFTGGSPYRLAHAGWWAFGTGVGGLYGTSVDIVQFWDWIGFDRQYHSLPPNEYPDVFFYHLDVGVTCEFTVYT